MWWTILRVIILVGAVVLRLFSMHKAAQAAEEKVRRKDAEKKLDITARQRDVHVDSYDDARVRNREGADRTKGGSK